jgi:hypothetical protein
MAGRNEVDLSELEDYRALSLDQRNAFKVRAPKADITEPDPFRASQPIATIAMSCLGGDDDEVTQNRCGVGYLFYSCTRAR